MERNEIKCQCSKCGTTWRRGEMGDNETLCFKCEHLIDVETSDYGVEYDTEDIEPLDD